MVTSIGGACKQNGAIYVGDKETVAVRESYSSNRQLHVAEIQTYAYGHTVRVWYTKLYHTRMVQNSDNATHVTVQLQLAAYVAILTWPKFYRALQDQLTTSLIHPNYTSIFELVDYKSSYVVEIFSMQLHARILYYSYIIIVMQLYIPHVRNLPSYVTGR